MDTIRKEAVIYENGVLISVIDDHDVVARSLIMENLSMSQRERQYPNADIVMGDAPRIHPGMESFHSWIDRNEC